MFRLTGLFLLVLTAGCATITRGTTQNIAIHTPGAPGAVCILSSGSIASRTVVTPATISVEKGMDSIAVRCTKECFHDGAGIVTSSMEAMTAGNILVGGVVGLGVDAMSGAMNKYNPDTGIYMAPIPGCRARA
jgi:hypothetical protein